DEEDKFDVKGIQEKLKHVEKENQKLSLHIKEYGNHFHELEEQYVFESSKQSESIKLLEEK
ncbi:hypothetical protein KI387_005734, partial [Taxus chinensis]